MKHKHSSSSKKVATGLPTKSDNEQTRKVGMMKQSSDFDRIEKENPFVGMKSNPGHHGGRK